MIPRLRILVVSIRWNTSAEAGVSASPRFPRRMLKVKPILSFRGECTQKTCSHEHWPRRLFQIRDYHKVSIRYSHECAGCG
jgi:hypothetical protein